MNQEKIIENTKTFVQEKLKNAESGHDFYHSLRVHKLAKHIASHEEIKDTFTIEIAALIHDIIDRKFATTTELEEIQIVDFLNAQNIDNNTVAEVLNLIENISFSKEISSVCPKLKILQDADRLDAMGAIGIARAFSYGGFKKRAFYNPEETPKLNMTKEEYKKSQSTTINHFYEKLLTLKDGMNTETAKKIAEKRHNFMLLFLEQFENEWNKFD